jgi:branched-chain amino acid transport system ATP-binding protein
MLRLDDLRAGYGKSEILHGVSLQLGSGCLCLLGRNGAGKTTLLRSTVGLTNTLSGSVSFEGRSLAKLRPYERARLGISLVPENRGIFAKLSVLENLQIAIRRGSPWSLDNVFDIFPRLKERLRNGGHQLSGGEQQMLAIARALVGAPKVLLLDEPTEGLSPIMVQEIVRVIRLVKDAGLPILLVEQSLATCLQVADRACILEDGHLVYNGGADELRSRTDLQERYLSVAT